MLPDAAYISVGAVSTGITAEEATGANATTMAAVIAAVRKAGVDERHLRTQQISVQPRFARMGANDSEGQAEITGYVARNSVAVTVVKLAIAPKVVGAAFGAGANSVSGPNLGNENPQAGMAEARADALRNARAKAEGYAAGLDMKVKRVVRASERGGSFESVTYISLAAPSSPVAGGALKRTTTVYIDYALVPK